MNDQYSICIWTILSFKAPPAFDGSTGSQQLSKQCSMFIALKCSSSFTNVYLSGIYPLFNESSLPFSSDIAIWIKNFQTNSLLPRSATHVSDEVQFHFPIPILVNWLFYIIIFRLFTRRSEFKNLWRRSPNSTDSWFALLDISPHPERAWRPYSEWALKNIGQCQLWLITISQENMSGKHPRMSFLTVNVQIWRADTKVVCKTVKPSAWRSQDAQLSTTTAIPHIAYWEAVICLLFLQAQMYIHHMTATGVLPQQVAKILQELLKLCIYICALLQFQCISFYVSPSPGVGTWMDVINILRGIEVPIKQYFPFMLTKSLLFYLQYLHFFLLFLYCFCKSIHMDVYIKNCS